MMLKPGSVSGIEVSTSTSGNDDIMNRRMTLGSIIVRSPRSADWRKRGGVARHSTPPDLRL